MLSVKVILAIFLDLSKPNQNLRADCVFVVGDKELEATVLRPSWNTWVR
jgi:hypothetical protein